MYDAPVLVDFVTGDATGLAIPAHLDAFLTAGPAFLTTAFRAFGVLSEDNAVTRIISCEPCAGGSTGHKFYLEVDYAAQQADLDCQLFLKFSRDFGDARRDWQRTEMESEAKFIALSNRPGFPIRVPKGYFADYEAASGTGIVITERIGYGEVGIEPHRTKCFDQETMVDPLPYYRAQISALASLAGAHKAGRLAADIESRFPFAADGTADPIRYSEEELRAELARCAAFAKDCAHLLPPEVTTPEFLARVERDALLIHAYEAELQAFLCGNPDLIALCHWNAHIDNLFFWQEADQLRCGLIDWGRVGQLTFGSILWGGLSAAHHDIWNRHLADLLALFVAEYAAAGGPKISAQELHHHLTVHMAVMGVARVLAFPEIIRFRLPEIATIPNRNDPRLTSIDPARNCLHVYINFLNHWQRADFGAAAASVLKQPIAAPSVPD